MKRKDPSPSPERLAILEKMKDLEAAGGDSFYQDLEPDPPGRPLEPEEVDFLKTKLSSKWKRFWANRLANHLHRKYRRELNMKVVGEENLAAVTGGVIVTSNHFSVYENLAVKEVVERLPRKRRFFRVIKETNYFLPGMFGFLMRNSDTLPISANRKTARLFGEALEKILQNGDAVLIYPEQAMWWNYRKPRPYKPGAFFYAAKHNVPILPLFVTMEDQDVLDEYNFPKQAYTIHIMPPIFPDPDKTIRENEREMLEKNQALVENKYHEVYGI